MTIEIENTTTPVEQVAAEQVLKTVEVLPESTTEQIDEVNDTPEQAEAKKALGTQKRIDALTKEKYGYKRDVEQARAESAQLREQLARLQQGEQVEANQGDYQTNVRQEAQRLNAEQSFNESCNKVYATGKAEFIDFDQSVANLQMVGVSRDFLELATTSDAGAKLIDHLGHDLDEAARISAMSPVQMARELTRLEFKLAQITVKPVSKAPAPINPIGAGGSTDSGLRDDLPIDEWMRRRNKERSR